MASSRIIYIIIYVIAKEPYCNCLTNHLIPSECHPYYFHWPFLKSNISNTIKITSHLHQTEFVKENLSKMAAKGSKHEISPLHIHGYIIKNLLHILKNFFINTENTFFFKQHYKSNKMQQRSSINVEKIKIV